ncbi:hypothetical protein D3C78_1940130 [compost metagenome]
MGLQAIPVMYTPGNPYAWHGERLCHRHVVDRIADHHRLSGYQAKLSQDLGQHQRIGFGVRLVRAAGGSK